MLSKAIFPNVNAVLISVPFLSWRKKICTMLIHPWMQFIVEPRYAWWHFADRPRINSTDFVSWRLIIYRSVDYFFPGCFLHWWWEIFYFCRKLWISINLCQNCRPTYSISLFILNIFSRRDRNWYLPLSLKIILLKIVGVGLNVLREWVYGWQLVNTTVCWPYSFFRKTGRLCMLI